MHTSIHILHNQLENGIWHTTISTMDGSNYAVSVLYCTSVRLSVTVYAVWTIWHSALSFSHFWNCLLCDWYICQYLCMESSNVHIFIPEKGGPCNNICTTSYPFYGNERHVISWRKEQTGIKQTHKHVEDKRLQAEVNWMAMTCCGESVNYLFYCMIK